MWICSSGGTTVWQPSITFGMMDSRVLQQELFTYHNFIYLSVFPDSYKVNYWSLQFTVSCDDYVG